MGIIIWVLIHVAFLGKPGLAIFSLLCVGIKQLIDCLQSHVKEIQALAAETLSQIITFRLAYNAVRREGGIKRLVRKRRYCLGFVLFEPFDWLIFLTPLCQPIRIHLGIKRVVTC